jgi:hypothetical protein
MTPSTDVSFAPRSTWSAEDRIRRLEHHVGLNPAATQSHNDSSDAKPPRALGSRLDEIETILGQKLVESQSSAKSTNSLEIQQLQLMQQYHSQCSEIMQLFNNLDSIGTALSYQSLVASPTSSVPLQYQRQELLSVSKQLLQSFGYIEQIVQLLSIGQPPVAPKDVNDTFIANAPIMLLESETAASQRIEELNRSVLQVQSTVLSSLAPKLDKMIHSYHSIIDAVSQHLVLMEEEIQLLSSPALHEI